MTTYQVMGYRVAIPETGMGAGTIVTLPDGWEPLSAVRQGETALILCCQEAAAPVTAPVIDSLSPSSLPVGSTPATVDVVGSGFDPNCTVYADTAPRSTFFLDATHIQYTSRPDLQSAPATVHITVQGAAGTSNAVPFTFA